MRRPANKWLYCEANAALVKLSASDSGSHVAAIDVDGKVHVFRAADDGKSIARLSEAAGEVNDATAVTLTDQPAPMAVIASNAGGVVLVGLADNKVIRKLDHGAVVDALAVTHDHARLITGGRDGKTRVWTLADGKPGFTMEGDSRGRLLLADATRDAERQKAAVARLNQRTGELEKLLATENEALAKVTEEHKKATDALAAEEKKRVDAATLVSATEAKIAKSTMDATKATATIDAATKMLTTAKATADAVAKEIEMRTADLSSAQKDAAKGAAADRRDHQGLERSQSPSDTNRKGNRRQEGRDIEGQ